MGGSTLHLLMSRFDYSTLVTQIRRRNIHDGMKMIIATSLVRHLTTTLAVIGCAVLFQIPLRAQSETHPYLGASMISLQQRLSAPAQPVVHSSFESTIDTLSTAYDLPVWIDRRVSRDRLVQAEVGTDESLGTLLEKIATQVDSSLILVDGIVVIAPRPQADTLKGIAWNLQASNLSSSWRKTEGDLGWPAGVSMREVGRIVSLRLGLKEEWTEDLEHDLWPAFQFKKIPKWSIAFCVLSSMDRTIVWGEGTYRIESITSADAVPQVDWRYTAKQIEDLGSSHCRAWKEDAPNAVIVRESDGKWRITATPDEHRRLVQPLVPKKKWVAPKSSEAVYSGTVQGKLGVAVQSIGRSLQIDFYPWPLPDAVANREIRVEYRNATVEQLLRDLGKAGGVVFVAKGGRYEIQVLPN